MVPENEATLLIESVLTFTRGREMEGEREGERGREGEGEGGREEER